MRSAGDVAAGVVRVAMLDVARVHHAARKDALAETGREPLELRFDATRHVLRRAVGHVAVGPERVLPRWRTRGIEQTLLRDQHERALGMLATPQRGLGRRDVVERTAEVDGPGAQAVRGAPWHRTIERVVDLENAGPAAVPTERAPVAGGQPVGRDALQVPRRG